MAFEAELESYLGAAYPFLSVDTVEEERLSTLVLRLLEGRPHTTLAVTGDQDVSRVLESLEQAEGPHVFMLRDFDSWLRDPRVERRLRNLTQRLEENQQTVIFVSPCFKAPEAFEQNIVRLTMPLPRAPQLEACLLDAAAAEGVSLTEEWVEQATRALQGLTLNAATRVCRRALKEGGSLREGSIQELISEKRRVLGNTEQLTFIEKAPGVDDVGGLERLKDWLEARAGCFTDEARAFGLPMPKGLLLVGVQGCGKSLTAKAVSGLWGLPLLRLDFSALYTYGASPEQNLRRALRMGEALAPVVFWVDEIDKAFHGLAGDQADDSLRRVFASFITWMQEKESPVFVVATANSVAGLPPELLRKGRFDEVFFVDLPSRDERMAILDIHVRAHGRDPGSFDLTELASEAQGFSGAELEQAIISGLYRAFGKKRELLTEDIKKAMEATVPLSRMAEDAIKALRDWAKTRARRASPDARIADLWSEGRS